MAGTWTSETRTSTVHDHVVLVSMPFGAIERPSLGLGLLQAHCRALGVPCETWYLNLVFAETIGVVDYQWMTDDKAPYTAFAGDWLFAEALYGARPEADAGYVEDVLRSEWHLDDASVGRLMRLRRSVEPFLDRVTQSATWADRTMVGFTSIFQQNIASLALAARLKEAHPHLTVAFGGANWEEAMGVALMARFPFVDLAFSGKADRSFPAVLQRRRAGDDVAGIPGVVSRSAGAGTLATTPTSAVVEDLDALPVPDFDPYFDQLRGGPLAHQVAPTVLVETARGCWWGERSHCTFCGLNGATMAFHSKSPERAVDEIAALKSRYGTPTFSVVDDILDMRYFRSVLPMLKERRLGVDFFWEVKANLTHTQVRQLRDAGVIYIQPGIESLSDHVLQLMRKGTTALRNVQLLKWCKEYRITPLWNLLYGFPGETAEDYEQTAALITAIWHLDPPTGCGPVRLDRFSPFHADPASFGMVDVRPMAPFGYLYPFPEDEVAEIAYYFDFRYADGRQDDTYAAAAVELTRMWTSDTARGMLWVKERPDGKIAIVDGRGDRAAAPLTAALDGWKAAVFLAADSAHTVAELAALPAAVEAGVAEDALVEFLENCARYQFMVRSADQWLGVAVHTPAREAGAEGTSPRRLLNLRVTAGA